MSARPDSGVQVPISDIDDSFVGFKIRTAGVVVDYDVDTALVTLSSGRCTVKVDVRIIVQENENSESNALLASGSKVAVLGTLVTGTSKSPLCISAIRIFDAHALDLLQWEDAARRMSQTMHSHAANG